MFVKTSQDHSLNSMLLHIGKVATSKLVPRNYLRYLETALEMKGWGIGLKIFVKYCGF